MISTPSALDDGTLAAVRSLIAQVEARDGAPPLSDQALLNLGSTSVTHLVTEGGYAQVDGDSVELVALDTAVLGQLLAQVEREPVLLWSHGRQSPIAEAAEARGWTRARVLWQLRRPVGPVPDADLPAGVTVRPFVVGRDEPAWLRVNAAAFVHHPEQGRMTLADLQAREAEDWFDPDGFLLAERGDELVGFHWTKIHPATTEHPAGVGEVYVLAVAPAAQGLRLGPALLVLGLRHLGDRIVDLYVDDDNPGAVRLYERFGFAKHDVDVQLRSPGFGG